MLKFLQHLDRRWIFLLMGLVVFIPLGLKLSWEVNPTQPVRQLYQAIEKLPPGSRVFLSFDYGPATRIECGPIALALVRHCFRKNIAVVGLALQEEGASLSREVFRTAAREYRKIYGRDYLNLGFKSGLQVLLLSLGKDWAGSFPKDIDGNPTAGFPLMRAIKNYDSFALGLSVSAATPGLTEYIVVAATQFKLPVGGGCTAVYVPEMYPYLNSGQLIGLVGGLKGAAEYETLLGIPGEGTRGMSAQSCAHLLIAGLIILANLVFFAQKLAERRERGS